MREKTAYPYTNFGFWRLFGNETDQDLLIDFLNSLLPAEIQIANVSFEPPDSESSFKALPGIYNLYCQNEAGKHIVIQLQKAEQDYFFNNAAFYKSFSSFERLLEDKWPPSLAEVVCIGILNFRFGDSRGAPQDGDVMHSKHLKSSSEDGRPGVTFMYVEMPNFNKKEEELSTRLDQWLFFMKQLASDDAMPAVLKGIDIFEKAFSRVWLAGMSDLEYNAYQQSLKVYRDLMNVVAFAREEGIREGREEALALLKSRES